MIDALRGIVQYVYTGIFQVVFRRALRYRKLEIMVQEKAVLKYKMIIYIIIIIIIIIINFN